MFYPSGGAYYLCGFGTHRVNISKVAKACNGRALAVEYRLAPQAAFPSQLLDALNSYLYLLYPPPGALHEPVPANEIVFAGDSAGGNLAFALLQLILQLHRTKPSSAKGPLVKYHGNDVEVPLPAGCSANSGWYVFSPTFIQVAKLTCANYRFDITRAMPSLDHNAKYDYLPNPKHDDMVTFPSDDAWPTNPPRGDLFCDLSLLSHPLVSPLLAKDWRGAPPLWIETGEEMLTDEDAVVAVQAASQGVTVHWEQYEAMPHCFAIILPGLPASRRCFQSWGDFCRKCVTGTVETSGTFIEAQTGVEKQVQVLEVTQLKHEEAVTRVKEAQARRFKGWEKEGKSLPRMDVA